jgi:DNA-binding NtrC family response regulator
MKKNEMVKVLIVEDERNQRDLLGSSLEDDFHPLVAASGEEALKIFEEDRAIGVIISDLKMAEIDGIELLKKTKKIDPDVIFILLTAYASVPSAVTALKLGAYDYITKPIVIEKLKTIMKRAIEKRFLITENRELKERLKLHYSFDNIITESPRMKEMLSMVSRVTDSEATVLITGESGTGKELIARAIHNAGLRADYPFIPINCSAIPESLLEAELFGYKKGSFTGAVKDKKGKLEIADKGSAFFDEIGDIPLTVQVKLLRFLQFGEIVPLGREDSINVDVRIICATNQDLSNKIEKGEFREDLYYRINVIEISIPALRDRPEDIKPLVNHFIEKYGKISGKTVEGVSKEAMRYLFNHNWPGNVRELESAIERAIVMSRYNIIDVNDLPVSLKMSQKHSEEKVFSEGKEDLSLKNMEKEHIQKVLASNDGNVTKTAEILGIHRNTLMSKMKEYGIRK